ncbi:centromere protein T isoform X2 [Nycticebus coucang]|uniref:centromere protein T isoform X2 n=1 Tax=Nycticebus coucang TaxID=9470 RepID=UPI00234DF850|nr:centromere protein T isoform X2 [Nycticebus coucang]
MASRSRNREPTPRTLLRRVLDTADPRTPRRPRSARAGAQRSLLETPSSRRLSSQTKTTARRRSYGAKSVGRLPHAPTSEHLEEQTPRTLLNNILLTAPESSILMPESVAKPVPEAQVTQPSRRKSSQGSLELHLPEPEPLLPLPQGLLAPGKRKQRLRLSVFQQGVDQGLPLSQEPRGNPDASSLASSLNLTFATPLQPQSVQRPGLARRPPNHRTVDVVAFLQDLRDTNLAPPNIVLEDTQPFSQLLAGCSPSMRGSLPLPSHMGAEDAEQVASPRTWSSGSGLQNNSPEKSAQFPAKKAEEVSALALGFPNTSNIISGDGVEPLKDGVVEAAEKRIEEEGLRMSEVKETTGSQGPFRAEQPEGHTEVIEAEGFQEVVEAEKPEESKGDEDTSGRTACPELASNTPLFLQTKQLHQFLELAPSPAYLQSPWSLSLPGIPLGPEPLAPGPVKIPIRLD